MALWSFMPQKKRLQRKKASDRETIDDEPPKKRLKVLIPTPTPRRSIPPETTTDPTPPRDEKKGKGIATEEEPLKNSYLYYNKDATMRIERDGQPLSLTVYEKFGLKQLGFTEWIEIQALSSKGKGKAIDTLLRSLKAKNLTPPQGIIGSPGLVITEPGAGIFYYNGNFDLVFQRESEFYLPTNAQLIRQLNYIQEKSPEAKKMIKKLELTIEARDDADEARKIVKDNLDGMGQEM
ncbi:hypothetical protein Tco_0538139 [Tanacetum coccineum]